MYPADLSNNDEDKIIFTKKSKTKIQEQPRNNLHDFEQIFEQFDNEYDA